MSWAKAILLELNRATHNPVRQEGVGLKVLELREW